MKQLRVAKSNDSFRIIMGPVTTGSGKRVNGSEVTLDEMLAKIAKRNGDSVDFPNRGAAEAALTAEEISRLAGLR